MIKKITTHSGLLVLATVLLAACAGKPKQIDGGFEYQDYAPAEPIKIPQSLSFDPKISEYRIDHQRPVSGSEGQQLSIFPPRLIAPIVTGSHIDELDPRTTIWFEQNENIDNLQAAIWNAVRGYLKKNDVPVANYSEAAGALESGWFSYHKTSGWWLWQESNEVEAYKFRFWVKMKPHGRSGSLTVELIERKALTDNLDQYLLDDDISLATETLNGVIGHFDYRLRLDAENRRVQYVRGIQVQLSESARGEPAFLIDAPYDHAWIRVIEALDFYDVVMTDVNKIQGRIYARVKSDNKGFWSNLFSSSEKIGLDKNTYVLELIRQGDKTLMVVNDQTLTPIKKSQLEQALPKLKARLAEDLE
ncbi:outer membrane protein assembly factor BamC [Gayadomonas joobiniege]|uniref:outer membrane protein assembly factor BamC n=1 Tax=Gayadomonas joobiniege TaxID=1234606 RepID=UPI00036FD928|nr:outer membrane protein assembly factor BamC [Gayadomonas joobiniege]